MELDKLKNECVLRAISAYEEDGISIFSYKDLSPFAKQDFIRERLKILANNKDIENQTQTGFYNQYKIYNPLECPEFIFEDGLHINCKCFLLELYNKLNGDYTLISTKELAKKISSQDTATKSKINKVEDYYGLKWNEVLINHSCPVKRVLANIVQTNLGTQYSKESNTQHCCKICGETNPDEFYSGYKTICKHCKNKQDWDREKKFVQDKNNIARVLYQRTKESFIRRDSVSEHAITEEDIQNQLNLQNYKCKYTGVDLCYGKGKLYQPSVDRIDSSLGYTRDNICIVSVAINDAKNDLSIEEFKQLIIDAYNNINNF